jgi:hypothetical protein
LKEERHYEGTAWFFTMQRLGGTLREWYPPQAELPREMLMLVAQIECGTSVADSTPTSGMKPSRWVVSNPKDASNPKTRFAFGRESLDPTNRSVEQCGARIMPRRRLPIAQPNED